MDYVENRMVVDSEWSGMEKEQKLPKGYFTQNQDTFVEQENLLEYAFEQTQKVPYYRDSFIDKVLDYIESDNEATEKFLKWFYPDYKEITRRDDMPEKITIERIEKAQQELFARLEEDLAIANSKDYYLTGKDIYYYTMAMRNLEELKKNAGKENKNE